MDGLRSSGLLGSETPRIFTPPKRDLTRETSLGFEAIDFAHDVLGIELMPWQKWLLIHALELNEDRTFRFRTWVLLVARQNGKTTLVMVLALWRMFVDGAGLVIGTAQNLDVAEEAWTGAVEMAEGVPELAEEIAAVDRTNGKKALRLESGERYKVAAASRRGGRGLSGDLVVLDELREHQSWDAWGAVTKTTMARPRPQVACLSNAGDESSVVLRHLREAALRMIRTGEGDDSLGLFEWSAPDGIPVDDRDGWRQANPALGHRITAEAIASAASTDPEHVFRTEVLCQWVGQMKPPEIDPEAWAECGDPDSQIMGTPHVAVDVSPGRWTAVAIVGKRSDDLTHVEVPFWRSGTDWVPEVVRGIVDRWGVPSVQIDPSGPAGSLVPALEAAGVRVETLTRQEMAQGCGMFLDAITQRVMRHLDDEYLNVTAAGAAKRAAADAWVWSRKDSAMGGAPLIAATMALRAAMTNVGVATVW